MIEDKDRMAQLVEEADGLVPLKPRGRDVSITIGKENNTLTAEDFTVVTTPYFVGDAIGRLGVLGPKRMDYEQVVRLVNYMAHRLSHTLSDVN